MTTKFAELELESRAVMSKLVNLVERRVAVHRSKAILPDPSLFDFADFDAWVISNGEQLMVQLNQIVVDMSIVVKKAFESKTQGPQACFDMDQEYHRKLQLLETIRGIGEFELGQDLEFFSSLQAAWRSDSPYGCFTLED